MDWLEEIFASAQPERVKSPAELEWEQRRADAIASARTCPKCKGTGEYRKLNRSLGKCFTCHGDGKVYGATSRLTMDQISALRRNRGDVEGAILDMQEQAGYYD